MSEPICHMLIGVPYSGKSTFVKNYFKDKPVVIISTDSFIEEVAKSRNKAYHEVFEDTISKAIEVMYENLNLAVKNKLNIVWDQTNLTSKSRIEKLSKLPTEYVKIGYIFNSPSYKELRERIEERSNKKIPFEVVQKMYKSFEPPLLEEGFEGIYRVYPTYYFHPYRPYKQ